MILAINTAFSCSDVALKSSDFEDYQSQPSSAKQSENILVCIDAMLQKHNTNINEVDSVGVVVGPGSFTGIRIGVGIVKGFSVAKPSLKLVGICSLDLMAHICKSNKQTDFWCVLNALSGNFFACKYDKNGNRLTNPDMFFGDIEKQITGNVVGLESERVEFCNEFINFDAKNLMSFTEKMLNEGKTVAENELLPIYLRKSQAEISLENKNAN